MSTYIDTYLPTFAKDLGGFDPQSLVGVYVADPDGWGSDIDGIDTLKESVEGMLGATDHMQSAWVHKVTDTKVWIGIICEDSEDACMPPLYYLVFVKVDEEVTA